MSRNLFLFFVSYKKQTSSIMKKSIVISVLVLLVLSCSSSNDTPRIDTIEPTLIGKGNLLGNGEEGIIEQNIVISDQNVWNNLIAQMNLVNNLSDGFTETNIDFSEYNIIAVFDELKGNGGHGLELNITSNSNNIVVDVIKLFPQGNATTIITQPYYIVKIPTSDLQIIFE